MGQRHQIYVALPPCYLCSGTGKNCGCNGCNGTGYSHGKVIGIHHQWLYGHTAIRLLGQTLKFVRRATSYNPFASGFDDPVAVLSALYSCDPESGYYHSVCKIGDCGECEDPRRGDNNDGITVIDLRKLDRNGKGDIAYCMVTGDDLANVSATGFLNCLSAREYVTTYYPESKWTREIKSRIAGVERTNAALLTLTDLKVLFPKMWLEASESRQDEET